MISQRVSNELSLTHLYLVSRHCRAWVHMEYYTLFVLDEMFPNEIGNDLWSLGQLFLELFETTNVVKAQARILIIRPFIDDFMPDRDSTRLMTRRDISELSCENTRVE